MNTTFQSKVLSVLRPLVMSLADDKAGDDYTEEFVRNIDSLSKADLHRFARVIDMNRLTLATYEHLKCCKGKTSLTLGKYLEPFVLRQQRLRQYRDRLLRKLVYLLEDSKIEYVVYKTMNLSKWVGVDIDVLVDSSSLDECILILLANGFHPTENLSKKYATHLAAERNPIAVDLHAKITVFGIPYMSSDILLNNRRRHEHYMASEGEKICLSVLDDSVDMVVRVAHSVIKEGTITGGDIADVIGLFNESCIELVRSQHLQLTWTLFACAAKLCLDIEISAEAESNLLHSLSRRVTSEACITLPFRVPVTARFSALLDYLAWNNKLVQIPLGLRSLRYRSSVSHLGHRLIHR